MTFDDWPPLVIPDVPRGGVLFMKPDRQFLVLKQVVEGGGISGVVGVE
jgi:hypothetical protein